MLENVNFPKDIKTLNTENLNILCEEIRDKILYRLSNVGGHIGSNLGIVECVVAMHYVFNSPIDKFIFDVSHQCYAHKILTGRKYGFEDIDKMKSISGFTKPEESEHDHFFVGHTSTSVSLALGVSKARDILKEKYNVLALIGDGSLSGGEALEGLDFAGEYNGNLIIIVNDNQMSIAENHGGLYKNLKELRDTKGKCEHNIFKAFGLEYKFLEDGNDIEKLIKLFESVKNYSKPVVLHICTEKGKGYKFAEENKEQWHWHPPFEIETGKIKNVQKESYVNVARDYLLNLLKTDEKVAILCAGTPGAIGFSPDIRKIAGDRFIDVGIAEETAVAMISGMAKKGTKPIFCVQSSFLQRCYDQLSQDLSLNKSPAVILVYSSGVEALFDATHLGIFDMTMTESIPNLTCLSPCDKEELIDMLNWAVNQDKGPCVIRLPFGTPVSYNIKEKFNGEICSTCVNKGKDVALFGLGNYFKIAVDVFEILREKGIEASLYNARCSNFEKSEIIDDIKKNYKVAVTIEDGVLNGGYGNMMAGLLGNSTLRVLNYGIKKQFIDRFNLEKVLEENKIDPKVIASEIIEALK